jgi:hypothetical protein
MIQHVRYQFYEHPFIQLIIVMVLLNKRLLVSKFLSAKILQTLTYRIAEDEAATPANSGATFM